MHWSALHPVLLPAANLDDVITFGYRAGRRQSGLSL